MAYNFGKNDNTNGFKQNPQNINRKGRPRKLVSDVLKDFEDKGIEGVKPDHILTVYERLLNLDETELKAITNSKDLPMLTRIISKAMLSGKGFEVIEKMIDRVHGSAKQNVNISGKIETEATLTMNINNIANEKLKEMPINLMMIAMVAARSNVDPLKLMGDLAKSYYNRFSGFTKEDTSKTDNETPLDINTINYDWNAISKMYEPEGEKPIVVTKKTSDKNKILNILNKKKG